jgi:hypothetical protein
VAVAGFVSQVKYTGHGAELVDFRFTEFSEVRGSKKLGKVR